MKDFGWPMRRKFIKDFKVEQKVSELRQKLHDRGLALLGEEVEAERRGWKPFHPRKKWKE